MSVQHKDLTKQPVHAPKHAAPQQNQMQAQKQGQNPQMQELNKQQDIAQTQAGEVNAAQQQGMEPLHLEINDTQEYQTQAVQRQNIEHVAEPAPVRVFSDSFDEGLMALTYQDFIKMMGTYNRGQVELVNGKLQIINNHYFSSSRGKESTFNRLLRERFFVLAMQKLGNRMTPELYERLRGTLQLDQEGAASLPLTRKQIQEVLADVNMRTSMVTKLLFQDTAADPAQLELAKKADQLVAGKMSAYDRSHVTPESQQRLREEIEGIFEKAKKLDKKLPSLSKHQMDNLVNGNIELVREGIYRALSQCYAYRTNINKGEPADVKKFLESSYAQELIAAHVICQMAAVTEEGRALAGAQLEQVILRAACGLYDPKKEQTSEGQIFYSKYQETEFKMFSVGGADGLEDAVEKRIKKSKKLRENPQLTEQGKQTLSELCNLFRELDNWKEKGIRNGLSVAEERQMNELGNALAKIFREENKFEKPGESPLGMVAMQLKGTRFAEGYERMRQLRENKSVIKLLVSSMSNVLKRKAEYAVLQEQPAADVQMSEEKQLSYEVDMLKGAARDIASVICMKNVPSDFITKAGDERIGLYRDIYGEMAKWKSGGAHTKQFTDQGMTFTMEQKESGLMTLAIDDSRLTLPVTAGLLADALETDIVSHEQLYGNEPVKQVFQGLDPDMENPAEWTHMRMLCLKYLEAKTGTGSDRFTNIPTNVVRKFSIYLQNGTMTIEDVEKAVSLADTAANSVMLNGAETIELIGLAEEQAQKERRLVTREYFEERQPVVAVRQEEDGWTKEERQIRDLVADCVFSVDTWTADRTERQPGVRLQKMLERNLDTLVLLVREPKKLEDLMKRLPLLQETGLTENLHTMIAGMLDQVVYRMAKRFLPDAALKEMIRTALHTDRAMTELIHMEAMMEEKMESGIQQIQAQISRQTQNLFGDEEPQTQQTEEPSPELKRRLEADPKLKAKYDFKQSVDQLESLMREAASGSRGQGRFMKLVLNNYFEEVSPIDRRAMFASALRNARPAPNLPEHATKEEKERAERQSMGANLGGFLKGAGPLLHKMLQGLPMESMPEELRDALKDMKSNLAPIPEEIVRVQMDAMAARSHGQVDRIEIVRALGAASVGQAFLCKLHGPNLPDEGKDVVIKLLRPDVRNRMEREKPIMLKCARQTDENEGMLDTYRGQLSRIEEELDLTLEAANVREGRVYDEDWSTVKSMKLSQLIEPTVNSMVVERASGTTVDKFMEDVRQTTDLLATFYSYDDQGNMQMMTSEKGHRVPILKITPENAHNYAKLRTDMIEKLEQLKKRQVYMTQLARTWVTEGIFGEGFYHGDLHAGNIMVDDDGLTVIDFGNATKLTKEQQVSVTRMVAAAAFGDMKGFRSGLHQLLEYQNEEEREQKEAYFNSKEEELGKELEKIFALGNSQYSGQRIAVALLKAQELGIQVPPAIFNFSQCQIRLQNALSEMNGLITTLQQGMELVPKMDDLVDKVMKFEANEAFANQTSYSANVMGAMLNVKSKESFFEDLEMHLRKLKKEEGINRMAGEIYSYVNQISTMEEKFNDYKKGNQRTENDTPERHASQVFRDFAGFIEENLSEELKAEYIDCLEHATESEQRFAELINRIKELTDRDRDLREQVENTYSEWYQAAKTEVAPEEQAAHEEQVKALQERLYEQYTQLSMIGQFDSSNVLGPVRKQLEKVDPQAIHQVDTVLKPLFENTADGGAELLELYKEFRAAQRQQAPELLQKERSFLMAYREMSKKQYEAIDAAKNYRYQWEYQDSFFDVMGDVIAGNIRASLARLGTAAVKYASNMAALDNNPDQDYDKIEQELKQATAVPAAAAPAGL